MQAAAHRQAKGFRLTHAYTIYIYPVLRGKATGLSADER